MIIAIESQDEGFHQQNNDKIQFLHLKRQQNLSPKAHSKHIKLSYKNALSIYNSIHLYRLPNNLINVFNPKLNTIQQHNSISPLNDLLTARQYNTQIINNSSFYSAKDYQQKTDSFIFKTNKNSEGYLVAEIKINQYFPQKCQNIYNKHNENYQVKSDMTIFLRNINLLVKNDMTKPFLQELPNNNLSNNTVQFFSEFQSGNLLYVFKDKKIPNLYYLFLQNDTNTHGYNQWFYFGIRNSEKMRKIRIIIINISKEFRHIPSIPIISFNQIKKTKTNFLLYKNKFQKHVNGNLNSLDFQYSLNPHENMYFSLTFPYTYSNLISFLKNFQKRKSSIADMLISSVGKSQAKNQIPYVKISSSKCKQGNDCCIIVLARQHPCETVGSYICEKIMESLFKISQKNQCLLELYNWYFIPMCNPDGVIHGNSRTNLKGYDINRCWDKNSLMKSVQAQQINQLICDIAQKQKVMYIFDLHGHSKQFGSFCYFSVKNQLSKLLSYYLCQSQLFDFTRFKFGLSYHKRPTLRGQMFYRLGIKNAITIETSLFGYIKNQKFISYQQSHFTKVSEDLTNAIWQAHRNKTNLNFYEQKKTIEIKFKEMQYSVRNSNNNFGQQSDSDPQGDYLQEDQRNIYKQSSQSVNIKSVDKNNTKQDILRRTRSIKSQTDLNLEKIVKSKSELNCLKTFTQQQKMKKTNRICRKMNSRTERKPIYTSYNVNFPTATKTYLNHKSPYRKKTFNQQNQLSKSTDFRRTLRRSNMSSSSLKKNSSVIKHQGTQMKSLQPTVYPTASNNGSNFDKIIKQLKQKNIKFGQIKNLVKQKEIKLKIKKIRNGLGIRKQDLQRACILVSTINKLQF